MPYGYVEAGAAVVGALGSLSGGGASQSPTAAGWNTNAMALTDMMGTSSANQFDPYNLYSSQWADQTGQAQQLQQQASSMANQFNTGQAALTAQQAGLSGQVTDASNAYLNGGGGQAQYLAAMNGLVPAYYGAGNNAFQMGGQLQGQMSQAQQYGDQIMQMALDPQQQLYNQQYQLQSQQSAANQASRGLAMSGVGAELSNQADQNFNLGWQNNLLSRATTGLSAYDANNQSIAGLAQGANQSYTTGLQDYTSGASIPYTAANTVYTNNQQAYANQQAALQAQMAAYLQQQQTAQQGFTNQAGALTGYQQALANQQNNLSAGNAWYQQQEQNLMGYYNGSIPTYNAGQQAAVQNGYAGLGQAAGILGNMNGGTNTGASPLATGMANMSSDPIGSLNSYYGWTSPYSNASAYSQPDSTAYGSLASSTPYDGTDASTAYSFMGSVE